MRRRFTATFAGRLALVYPKAMIPEPALRNSTIALVGLMGVGKSSIGKRLATLLDLPFRDADEEIEKAAGCSISDIFAARGEAEFREGERRVIARLLDDPPHVLATGGGAFVQPTTRALIKRKAISVWLQADIEVLARRVARKDNRPLLHGRDARLVLAELAQARYPAYAEADVHVSTSDTPHQASVDAVLAALTAHLRRREPV